MKDLCAKYPQVSKPLHICMTVNLKMAILFLFQWPAVAKDLVLFLFQWPAVAKELVLCIITGTGSKHSQKHMAPISWVFNAWLAPKNNRTTQPVDLIWVNHNRVAHLLILYSIDTHRGLSLTAVNNLIHLWPPDMPCYIHRMEHSTCVNCAYLIWGV